MQALARIGVQPIYSWLASAEQLLLLWLQASPPSGMQASPPGGGLPRQATQLQLRHLAGCLFGFARLHHGAGDQLLAESAGTVLRMAQVRVLACCLGCASCKCEANRLLAESAAAVLRMAQVRVCLFLHTIPIVCFRKLYLGVRTTGMYRWNRVWGVAEVGQGLSLPVLTHRCGIVCHAGFEVHHIFFRPVSFENHTPHVSFVGHIVILSDIIILSFNQ